MMRYLSVCSGVEAATQAWHSLGWVPVAFSEIEPFPCAVLAHHYPGVPNWGDMTKFQEWPDADVDVLCGGTPCQSFSVAGLRQGLADPRGNLMLTFGALAARYRAKWLVWENVPGVLSSNGGRDFGSFLWMLGQLGYGVAYRVLDAQHVRTRRFPRAVPQRRRRVFVVGYLGDWRRAAAVLFDRESLSGHPAPRREAGQRPAPTISARPTGGGGLGTDFDLDGGLIAADVAPTINAHFGDKQGLENQHINGGCGLFVAHTLRGEGHDASEDGTGRQNLVPVAIQERAVSENPDAGPDGAGVRQDGASYTLEARTVPQAVAHPITLMQRGRDDGPSIEWRQDGTANALLTPNGGRAGMGVGCIAAPVAFAPKAGGKQTTIGFSDDGACQTLGTTQEPAIVTPWAVRRLTPVECERLMGFPDGFTLIPSWASRASSRDIEETARWIWTGDNRINGMTWDQAVRLARHPDGPRYKALGNSWAVNVAEWVGERIAEVNGWEATA